MEKLWRSPFLRGVDFYLMIAYVVIVRFFTASASLLTNHRKSVWPLRNPRKYPYLCIAAADGTGAVRRADPCTERITT